MRVLKKISIALLIVFIGIQFIPTTRNQSSDIQVTDIVKSFQVPEKIEKIFKTSCYDCHSNNTNYPWYNKMQPVAWFLEDHIKEGKSELNFSEFGAYSKRRQKSKFKSIASQIEDGEMPLSSYTMLHQDAKLSSNDKEEVLAWIDRMIDNLNNN